MQNLYRSLNPSVEMTPAPSRPAFRTDRTRAASAWHSAQSFSSAVAFAMRSATSAQRGLRDVDIEIQNNIVLTALEELVRPDIQDKEKTPARAAKSPGTALPCQADLGACIHTGGDLDFLFDLFALQTAAMAGFTGR